MRFINSGNCEISTVFDGMALNVPVGGTVEIPDWMAHAVAPRGLPLKPVEEPQPEKAFVYMPSIVSHGPATMDVPFVSQEPKRGPGRPRKQAL